VGGPIALDVAISFSPDSEPRVVFHGTSPGTSRSTQGADVSLFPSFPPPPPWAEGVPRVGGAIKPPTRVRQVHPVYPALAQASRVAGVVMIEARLEPDGRVGNARVVRSIPLLDQAALDAVMQWEFEPALLDDAPIPVLLTVTIQFSLS
jgi:TonB family protein